jgi:hypothetical protein
MTRLPQNGRIDIVKGVANLAGTASGFTRKNATIGIF